MTDPKKTPATFGSADDLPTVRELQTQLRGFKMPRFMMNAEQKSEFKRVEKELDDAVSTVDSFYSLLGVRNWIFHNDANLPQSAR